MSGCQSCSVLFHMRSNRKQGKWKWTYKPDIWPPCSIQKWGEIFVKHSFFRLWMQFSPTRGCFSQMFKKQISKHSSKQFFGHQFCLWKTPSSRFFLFSPLCMHRFCKTFSPSNFWGVKKAPCKKIHVFGENWQRNHFPKLTTLWLLLYPNVTTLP